MTLNSAVPFKVDTMCDVPECVHVYLISAICAMEESKWGVVCVGPSGGADGGCVEVPVLWGGGGLADQGRQEQLAGHVNLANR